MWLTSCSLATLKYKKSGEGITTVRRIMILPKNSISAQVAPNVLGVQFGSAYFLLHQKVSHPPLLLEWKYIFQEKRQDHIVITSFEVSGITRKWFAPESTWLQEGEGMWSYHNVPITTLKDGNLEDCQNLGPFPWWVGCFEKQGHEFGLSSTNVCVRENNTFCRCSTDFY